MDTVDRSHSTVPSRKPTLSIRARLVILALLAVVPLMFDRVRLLEQSRLERIEDAATDAIELARRSSEGQREIITTTKAMLQVMARAYVGMIATGTTCNFYLSDLAAGMPWVNGLSIVGDDGKIKCSTIPNAVGVDHVGSSACSDGAGDGRIRSRQLHHRPPEPQTDLRRRLPDASHRRERRCRRRHVDRLAVGRHADLVA